MTWGTTCDVENFLLKVTTHHTDGTISEVKSVPCEAGSAEDICMVEISLDLKESGEPMGNEDGIGVSAEPKSRRMASTNNKAGKSGAADSTGRRKLDTAHDTSMYGASPISCITFRRINDNQVDVMVIYSEQARESRGTDTTATQMATIVTEAVATTNEAFANSLIDLRYRIVFVDQLQYDQDESAIDALVTLTEDEGVATLRDRYGADLVQLFGSFQDYCGAGWFFNGSPGRGFSTVGVSCISNLSHTHEWGHNMGADHNREDSSTQTDFAHGRRYCDGDVLYRTVMSYFSSFDCPVPRVNYFSNPEAINLGLPTGTSTEDNARMISETMVNAWSRL
ncbi:unnamed protein product [Sphacelaria rigidula]